MPKLSKQRTKDNEKNLKDMLEWYRLAFLARKIDDIAQNYIRKSMGWSYHARCSGHEGIQVALGLSFRAKKDFLFPYYRDTATVLAAGITPLELIRNGLSKATDVASGGRHMSNHFAKPEIHIQNVSSCTGNQTQHAVGVARAIRYYNDDAISFCSQGDSSLSEGYCYEAINGASREKLPVIFVVQNNGYGISVPVSEQTANEIISDNFRGIKNLGIFKADGCDFNDSTEKMNQAIAYVREKGCPAMVHAQVVRIGAHSNSDAQELYRSEDELKEALKHDPLEKLKKSLLSLVSESKLLEIEEKIVSELKVVQAEAEKEPSPDPSHVDQFVFGPSFETSKKEEEYEPIKGEPEKLREAINRTLIEEFEHNPDTFLWGQDCASKKKGGVFNLTKGMLEKFGNKRVFNAPIAEDYIVGTANGMSRYSKKIRIVIEAAQFADYIWPAMEQIVEMGHEYWRSNGQFCPNVVMRLASGGYIQGGLYHSQNVEAIMSHLPGIRVVYPSFADDAAGLLRTSIRSEGPTFFLEPKYLYNRPDAKSPNFGKNFAIPFGKGRIRKAGEDLSIITYGNTVHMALKVAHKIKEEKGLDVEVFDLRSIRPLDTEGLCSSAKKCGKVLVVHEDHQFNGIGGEIISIIMENCFFDLDAPVKRLAAKDIPIGFSKILENAILPQEQDILNAVIELSEF